VSKQGAHYFYKLLVKMIEKLEFLVTQFNKVVFYDFSKIKNGIYTIVIATIGNFTITTDSNISAGLFLNRFKHYIKLIYLEKISWLLTIMLEL